jgi:hypothetical protein
MASPRSPYSYTSSDLEKIAIIRYRSLLTFLPPECKIFRELWGRSTVICLDFEQCPDQLEKTAEQSFLLSLTAHYLGLAESIVFRVGNKVIKWMTMKPVNS